MPCSDFTHAMQAYVEGELDGEARTTFEAHLARCERCREEAADLRAVREWLRAAPGIPVRHDFTERVLARLDAAPAAATRRPWFRYQRVYAMAASILVVAGLGALIMVTAFRGEPDRSRDDLARRVLEEDAAAPSGAAELPAETYEFEADEFKTAPEDAPLEGLFLGADAPPEGRLMGHGLPVQGGEARGVWGGAGPMPAAEPPERQEVAARRMAARPADMVRQDLAVPEPETAAAPEAAKVAAVPGAAGVAAAPQTVRVAANGADRAPDRRLAAPPAPLTAAGRPSSAPAPGAARSRSALRGTDALSNGLPAVARGEVWVVLPASAEVIARLERAGTRPPEGFFFQGVHTFTAGEAVELTLLAGDGMWGTSAESLRVLSEAYTRYRREERVRERARKEVRDAAGRVARVDPPAAPERLQEAVAPSGPKADKDAAGAVEMEKAVRAEDGIRVRLFLFAPDSYGAVLRAAERAAGEGPAPAGAPTPTPPAAPRP